MAEPTDLKAVAPLLLAARVVAVLGAHPSTWRPAHYVPAYLISMGYRVIPVNPGFVGQELFGAPTVATLAEIPEPVDLVDVFRPGDRLRDHEADILAMRPLPTAVWFQQGIRNDDVAGRLRAAGITVVQDRCTLADHQSLALPRIAG